MGQQEKKEGEKDYYYMKSKMCMEYIEKRIVGSQLKVGNCMY